MDNHLNEELEHHLEQLRQQRIAQGAAPAEADRFARRKLGNTTRIQEDALAINVLHQLLLARRNFTRAKAPTAILALGIGMSAAMFSLVDAVILRPLPFPNQDRIVVIQKADPLAGPIVVEMAYPELGDLQQSIPALESVALLPPSLYGYGRILQLPDKEPVRIEGTPVSSDYFRVLGVTPALGRGFHTGDERVVILSDAVWRQHLSANPNIIGRVLNLSGVGHTVIGVLPPGAEFPRGAGIWYPLPPVERRGATYLQAVARLRPDASPATARPQINTLFTRLAKEFPQHYSQTQTGVVIPIAEYWTGSSRPHLWIMLGASLLLLIAAAISAGNLILSRTLARRQEIATRTALGAQPAHILAVFAAEGFVSGLTAAAAGLAIAYATIQLLIHWAPADIPRLANAAIDLRSFVFAASAAITASVAATVIPGWLMVRADIEPSLRAAGTRSGTSRHGTALQSAFVFAQAAVTVALLCLATFLVLSYRGLMGADNGFANHDALTVNIHLHGATRANLVDRLREAPGITHAAAVLLRPLEGPIGWDVPYTFAFEETRAESSNPPKSNYEAVTPGYFDTVGTPILEGRDFTRFDTESSEPVVIIGSTLAARLRAAGVAPLGHRLRLGLGRDPKWLKIVGVTATARYRGLAAPTDDIFVPHLQAGAPLNYVVVRGTRPAGELEAEVRHVLASINPSEAIARPATIGALIEQDAARHRFNMILLSAFGICALLLAATAIFSVVAETVATRRREIAIKSALGAAKPRLIGDLVIRALAFVLAGETAGLLIAAALGQLGSGLLYDVSPRDPAILGAVFTVLFTISLASAWYPAWMAAGADAKSALETIRS